MILERVPGKNLQEKRFQTSLKSHSLPGRRTWNVVDGGKTEKKKQRNYPRGQTRIGVVQKRGEPTRGEKSTSFFPPSFFITSRRRRHCVTVSYGRSGFTTFPRCRIDTLEPTNRLVATTRQHSSFPKTTTTTDSTERDGGRDSGFDRVQKKSDDWFQPRTLTTTTERTRELTERKR